jgi:hypothetical protein
MVLECCGDAPHDRQKKIESSRRELEATFTRVSVSVWKVCVVPRGGHGKSKIKYTNLIVKMDRLPDPPD